MSVSMSSLERIYIERFSRLLNCRILNKVVTLNRLHKIFRDIGQESIFHLWKHIYNELCCF